MATTAQTFKSGKQLSARSILIWRVVKVLVWLVGLTIFLCLIFYPSIGTLLFWNVLIPVAPALLVVATGVWRNVCPLANTVMLPRHLDLSQRKKMPVLTQNKLQLVAIIALYLIVPLRHLLFNNSGIATAILLFSAAIIGISMGFVYDWKSAWCSSLCPVHPVEKLYGGNTFLSIPNAHCDQCANCTVPCPDSTPNMHPGMVKKNIYNRLCGLLTIGGLPGFIWGWFHVPDHVGPQNPFIYFEAYAIPLCSMGITIFLFMILKEILESKNQRVLVSCFSAAGVSCYYWYRIPALFGFGKYADDGLLISLRGILNEWSITFMIITTTIFFFWWLVYRKPNAQSWVVRPEYMQKFGPLDL